jgi:EAL domain-containing protein (putative c-di-GMP-specific phosphodiesterase class I)
VAKDGELHRREALLRIAPHRLLGFAFASADLLLEVEPGGVIGFAIGAAGVIAGAAERSLIGRTLGEFIDARDQALVDALIGGADGDGRQGPVAARLAADPARAFAICVCKLPQNEGAVSCALTRAAPPVGGSKEGGLHDRHEFEAVTKSLIETARATGQQLELSFVEMDGLDAAARALPTERRSALRGKIAGALRAQSHGGAAAAQLGDERYALVRTAGESADAMAGRLERLIALTDEIRGVKLGAKSMALKGEASSSQLVRALRYALDDFIEGGAKAVAPLSLQDAVSDQVRQTMKKASALTAAVAGGRFKLAYQPVVGLKTGELHHHEVLVRFGPEESPFPMIRMAEELDLIEELDLAVVHRAAEEMARAPQLKLAVNVSGRTITSPGFIARIDALVKGQSGLKDRLMFEVTESATIDDLVLANRHIQTLRGLGCLVCLDDFGAGAASLAYLQQLSLDVVKIDGRYIRELQHGGRESTFLRHLVRMCGELKVKTLAEMVETTQIEEAVRRAGVDFGQGWLYGAPAERPSAPPPTISRAGLVAARRVGEIEGWR